MVSNLRFIHRIIFNFCTLWFTNNLEKEIMKKIMKKIDTESGSSKNKKAKELGIPVITSFEFKAMIEG